MYSYTHNYVLDGSKILKETILYSSAFNGNSTTTLEYYYDESGIASFRYNGTYYYYLKNLQGDVIGIIDNTGAVVVEYAYDAWGNILSVTGSLASTVGQTNPFRYRSYYYDTETGLYYLNSRYYDPQVSRFINADAYVSTGQGILGNNMFAYCLNNPVSRIDAYGADSVSVTVDDDDNPLDDMGNPSSGTGGGAGGSGYVGGSGSVGTANLPAASGGGSSFIGGCKETSADDEVDDFLKKNNANPEKVRSSFKGKPTLKTLSEDTVVYRYWGGDSPKYSHWVSPILYGSDARALLALPPENTMSELSYFILSRGTMVLVGEAAPYFGQPGGGIQYWVPWLE